MRNHADPYATLAGRIGEELLRYRKARGISQKALAGRLAIGRSTLSAIENGDQLPALDVFIRICAILGKESNDLLRIDGKSHVIVDTNILLRRLQSLEYLTSLCDQVHIPEAVIDELNNVKDRARAYLRKQASKCESEIIRLNDAGRIDIERDTHKGTGDERIFACAVRVARAVDPSSAYLLTNDKDFSLKDASTAPNLQVIDFDEFERLFVEDDRYSTPSSQEFFAAIERNDTEGAQVALMNADVDVNYVDGSTGLTPLIHAVRSKNSRTIDYLLDLPGIDVNAVDSAKYAFPPITHAVQLNAPWIVAKLIEKGANVNEPSANKRNPYNTPLMVAAWHGRLQIVRMLVENGACINQQDQGNGFTALIKAACNNYPDVARYLIGQGADRAICSFEQKTALDYAYAKNQGKRNQELIDVLRGER